MTGIRKIRSATLFLASLLLVAAPPAPAQRRGPPPQRDATLLPIDPAPSTYRPLPRRDTIVRGVTLLDGAGGRLERSDILIQDGRIVAVGQNLSAPGGVAEIDGTGRWATPGIIDVHSHNGTFVAPLTASDAEASDVSEVSSPNAAGTWIEHAVNPQDPAFFRALESGVTTLQVLPGSIPLIGGRSVILKTVPANDVWGMKFPGATQGVKLSCGDNARSFFGSKGRAPNSRMGAIEALREALSGPLAHDGKPPPPDNMEAQTIFNMVNGKLPVHVHCYRASDIAVIMNLGKEFGLRIAAIHHATEAYKVPQFFRDTGTCAVVWSDWWGFKTEAGDGIKANAAFVDAAGGCTALHSDSPALGQRLNLEAAKAMAAGRRAGVAVTPEQAIRWITSNPAKILGLDDRIGTVTAGKNADLVIWSGDPFSVYSKPEKVFIDGALLFDRNDPARQPKSDFELGRIVAGTAR